MSVTCHLSLHLLVAAMEQRTMWKRSNIQMTRVTSCAASGAVFSGDIPASVASRFYQSCSAQQWPKYTDQRTCLSCRDCSECLWYLLRQGVHLCSPDSKEL